MRGPYAGLADRLAGVNCRHSLGPYLEGQPRAYSPDPDADAGLRPGEAYEAAQRQRAIERRIRASKRQIAALEGSLEKGAANNDEIRNAIAAERVRLGNAQREMRGWVKSHQYLVREPGREKAAELDSQPRPLSARTRALRLRDERVAKGPNTVHMAAQNKHIPGTKEFAEKKASMERKAAKNPGGSYPGQSYFTMPADEVVRLVEDSVGKGEPSYGIDGDWYKRERCRASGIVGRVVEMDGGTIDTEWFTIHYSDSRGVHAVPAAPPKERP